MLLVWHFQRFFDHVNARILKDFLKASHELIAVLHEDDKTELRASMDALEERWKELQFHAPVRLLKLEFQAPEMEFLQLLAKAEQTLSDEEKALEEKANVKEILRTHQVRRQPTSRRYSARIR